ncbi:hypothetical protein ROS9278_04519 [Roseomonas sp. CECT 9278]|nr:hypothetical protein ROS9278_04519 [Roseomonas sp. CECT 9278]
MAAGEPGAARGAGRSAAAARAAISSAKARTACGVTELTPKSTTMRPMRPVKAKGTW